MGRRDGVFKYVRGIGTLLFCCLLLLSSGCAPGGTGGTGDHGTPFTPSEIAGAPAVDLPDGISGSVTVEPAGATVPALLEDAFVPISGAWNITLDGAEHYDFGNERAILRFQYDPLKLDEEGLLPEFVVYGYNETAQEWERVDLFRMEVSGSESFIIGETCHFSTFLPAAAGAQTTGVIAADGMEHLFPDGIGGWGGAVFSLIDENFTYYQDRDYRIVPASESADNLRTFNALGLDGSIGLSTFNGGSAAEPYQAHKYYDGTDYIKFTAHMDLDLYLLYDTRGGEGPEDISGDASWISYQYSGFETEIGGQVYYLETTDPVGLYRVYRKSYTKGQLVVLQGNWFDMLPSDDQEVDTQSIQTNYWAIIKPKGNTASDTTVLVSQAVPVSGITLPSDMLSLECYGSADFPATLEPADATNKAVSWFSSDPTVAYFDPNPNSPWSGSIEANEPGTAVVTVTTADGGFTDSVTVTVDGGEILDSDGDGIPDYFEASGFTVDDYDGDGVDDIHDIDDDGDGIPTRTELEAVLLIRGYGSYEFSDLDGDGMNCYWDPDSDSDGVRDILEAYGSTSDANPALAPSGFDDDNDGLDDAFEAFQDQDPLLLPDFDGDGIPDVWDPDDDNDLVPTSREIEYTSEGLVFLDTDMDGAPDMIDPDDDNDGISTRDEDLNRNGKPWDDDSDGDGTPDYLDAE